MSNKIMKELCLMSAAMLAEQQFYFMGHRKGMVVENRESPKDRECRERCERLAMEKAKAKRERRAAKIRLLTRKEQ